MLKVNDIVRSKVNHLVPDMRYVVEKVFKTVCWVRTATGHGEQRMVGGKMAELRLLYKGIPYNVIEKVKNV